MTGLLNRRGFETRLSQTVWRAARGRQRAALLMVDLDGFKAINDSLGHDAGDEVIRVAGTRLRASIRYTDSAARMGGDEFAVLLVGVPDRPTTQAVVDRIHAELCAPLTVGERKVSVGASIGVTYLDSDLATTALKLADQAMFEAKRRGGGVELAGMT
jgi:diguanylate cyclase (GGDEF)-like protein